MSSSSNMGLRFEKRVSRETAILVVSTVLYLVVNLLTVNEDHDWGGDFSQYIMHAQNLLAGQDYSAGIMMNSSYQEYAHSLAPLKYPPLFPIVLVPVIGLFGVDFFWLKVPNVVLWALFVAVLYNLLKVMVGKVQALLGSLAVLFSLWFFLFKQQILSDVLFAFITTAALLVYKKFVERHSRAHALWLALFVLLGMLAFLNRYAGIALFIAAILHLSIFQRRYYAAVLLATALLSVTIGGQTLGLLDLQTNLKLFAKMRGESLVAFLWHESVSSLRQVVWFFAFPESSSLLLVGVFAVILLGFARRVWSSSSCDIVDVYTLVYFGMLVLFHSKECRFVVPVAGPLLAYGLLGIGLLPDLIFRQGKPLWTKHTVTVLLVALLLFNLVGMWRHRYFVGGSLKRPEVQRMVAWVKGNIAPDDHYVFRKPRVLALMTGRTGLPTPKSFEYLHDLCRKQNIKWVVLNSEWDGPLLTRIAESPDFSLAWETQGFKVFESVLGSHE